MKIAVYTIAKNESQFLERWAKSCQEADYRIICDTGSTDNSEERAEQLGLTWHQKVFTPWRFDTSRTWSIDCIPEDADWCIALDADEVLTPGWRQAFEAAISSDPHPETITRIRYHYVWSWNPNGSEGVTFGGNKVHCRHGYVWAHPVHEVLSPRIPEREIWANFAIHHHPDPTKSRSQYLPLLELAVEEQPNDARDRYYLGREYFFVHQYAKATEQLKKYLELSHWKPERASACRMLATTDKANELRWLMEATYEDERRENWVDLARYYYIRHDWISCYWAAKKAVAIQNKPSDFTTSAEAWGWLPYDYLAISAYYIGHYQEALSHGEKALTFAPSDARLLNNLEFYRQKA